MVNGSALFSFTFVLIFHLSSWFTCCCHYTLQRPTGTHGNEPMPQHTVAVACGTWCTQFSLFIIPISLFPLGISLFIHQLLCFASGVRGLRWETIPSLLLVACRVIYIFSKRFLYVLRRRPVGWVVICWIR